MGIIYVMVNIPFFWKVKIGITTFGRASKRVMDVNRTTPGFVIPIFFSLMPFGVPSLEQDLHKLFKRFHSPFHKGSGHTEWFLLPVAIPAILLIALTTVLYWTPFALLCWLAWKNG